MKSAIFLCRPFPLPRDSYRVVNLGVVEKPHDRNRAAAGETFTVVRRSESSYFIQQPHLNIQVRFFYFLING